ncbi:TPA: PAS domain S-box protein [Methanosarcina acetivorans]|uniref:Sensory transduction histidine kinase n=2 Tax=Methanosarcina acetivorans TaxID=2214 RepID=Q8TRA6_METAC|nr:PAS domain S-box protein [Methanosarcina acetivorans]AAM04693.1 sensory transduction histidine kinase [Methanosarcina acetivorans C2A]HIH94904.1 PAS domain S-box protein [Methanosarcina acetivorans]
MKGQLRKSGIDVVGDVPWGTHFCQFYQTKEDLIEILVPYFRAGLENSEYSVWITSEPLETGEAKEALRKAVPDIDVYLEKGQIEIISCTHWCLKNGVFDKESLLNRWVEKIGQALKNGYEGLRTATNISWLEKKDWNDFVDYEEQGDGVVSNCPVLSLCTYSLDRCNAGEIIDVVANHQFALIKREGKWDPIESPRRKRAEETALQATKNWEFTFDAVPDLIAILDTEYRIVRANRAMAARLGRTPEGCAGLICYRAIHGRDKPPSFCPYRQLLMDGVEHTEEVREDSLGGDFILSVSPLHDSEGKLTGCIHFARDITERKRAEEAVREGEERLRFALETSRTGAWDLDLVDHTAYRSLEHDRIFGYEQLLPQWTYEMFLDHVLPEDRAMVDEKFRKAITTCSDWSFECRIRRVDGELRWIWAAGRHLMDITGSVHRMAGIVQDITERKQLEEQTRQRAEEMETIMEVAPVAIWTGHDPQAQNITGNRMANELYEVEVGENISPKVTSTRRFFCQGRELAADELPMLQASIKDIDVLNAEIDVLLPSGELRGLLGSASPLHDFEGRVRGSIGTFIDITERKKAEAALRESEEKYRNLIETANEGIWILEWVHDSEARTTYVNKKMAEMLGYSREEIIGKSVRDFTDEEGKAIFEMRMKKRRQGISESHEFRLLRIDGSPLWALVNSKALFGKDGRFTGSMSMLTDITERKKTEAKLKDTLDNLENMVKKRTSELEKAYKLLKESERGLAEAQKMARLGSWEWNIASGELHWSDEKYRIFGHGPQEFIPTYDTFVSYIHPDDREYVNNAITEALGGKPYSIDYRIFRADGEESVIHAQGKVILDERNTPVRMKGTVQDITEQKKAEEMLKESESKLKTLFELLPVGVSIIDKDGKNIDVNLALERILGLSRSELFKGKYKARKYLRSNGTEMPAEEFPSAKALEEPGSIQISEIGVVKEDGSTIWTDVSATVLPFSDGQVAITTRDITESKKAKEELQRTEERYRIVTEQTGQLVYDYDVKKDTVDLTGSTEELTGFTPDELKNINLNFWISRIHPEDLNKFLENHKKHFGSERGAYRIEYRFRKKNEEYIYLEDNWTFLRDEKTNMNRTLGVIKDITERKQAEKTLANIEIARKKEIHHRIKNNLQVISSLLDLQAEKFRSREHVEDSEVLNAFKESQERVISIALIHEELHEGKGTDTLNFSPYLQRLVKNLFQIYNLGNVDISLSMDIEENVFFDMDTAVPLGLIVNELVSNSLKYAFKGRDKGVIRIKLSREGNGEIMSNREESKKEGHEDTNFVLTVSDNGVSIPEDFNLENSDTLGIQLVTTLVDQLDGRLEMKRGSGIEFIVRFPITEK